MWAARLFVDDFLIQDSTLKRECHTAAYVEGNPVFRGGMVFSDGVFYDPTDKLYKMWYHADGTSLTTSKDGIHWGEGKMVCPLPMIKKTDANGVSTRVKGKIDSTTVWLDLETKDSSQRFKMVRVTAGEPYRGMIYTSADGINWVDTGKVTGGLGDRSTIFFNPFRKVWVFSNRHGWGKPRARRYWEVSDMVAGPLWENTDQAPIWVGADELDPPREDYKLKCELYNLDCAGYESLMLGLFTIWRGDYSDIVKKAKAEKDPEAKAAIEKQLEGLKPRQKPNEVCVGFSRDGFFWSRPDRRTFIGVNEDRDAWNNANVQSAGGCCLVVGDKLYFYTSARDANGGNVCTGLSTLRRDGFASMAAKEEGTLTTRPIKFSGKHLFVNVDDPKGELTVEVLDEAGKVIAPFTAAQCRPVKADSTIAQVKWNGASSLADVAGKNVRLRFHLTNGRLYAFWVSPDASGASNGYVAAGGPGFTSDKDTVGEASYKAAK